MLRGRGGGRGHGNRGGQARDPQHHTGGRNVELVTTGLQSYSMGTQHLVKEKTLDKAECSNRPRDRYLDLDAPRDEVMGYFADHSGDSTVEDMPTLQPPELLTSLDGGKAAGSPTDADLRKKFTPQLIINTSIAMDKEYYHQQLSIEQNGELRIKEHNKTRHKHLARSFDGSQDELSKSAGLAYIIMTNDGLLCAAGMKPDLAANAFDAEMKALEEGLNQVLQEQGTELMIFTDNLFMSRLIKERGRQHGPEGETERRCRALLSILHSWDVQHIHGQEKKIVRRISWQKRPEGNNAGKSIKTTRTCLWK
ncbi:hypothetical protein J5N97_003931 [Dioscorea zingiberensis]|uniref:RNase H type-1 domain-containing protein n=1 Tax=Dioscorea zingiberensis TaxID=325984 RepID=A0A9D5HQI2_9LILI|nr:hypothetical protein J5N97_003931 [Dioscorea zingiberensis]